MYKDLQERIRLIEKATGAIIFGQDRRAKNVRIRSLVVRALRDFGLCYTEIGLILKRNHASVIHLYKKTIKENIDILAEHQQIINILKDIKEDNVYTYKSNSNKWDKIYKIKGYKCEICGFDEIIEIHHKEKEKYGNDIKNLMCLCPNCHAKLHAGLILIKKQSLS